MTWKTVATFILLVLFCGTAYGKTERWHKLTEDADLSYFIDDKSIVRTKSGTTLFWMKLVSRSKDFLKKEYRMADLEYILFNYEINCDKAVFKSRGVIYYGPNGKQLDKQAPTFADMSDAEPVPPESMMEVAQDYVCAGEEESLPERQAPLPENSPAPAAREPELPSEPAPPAKWNSSGG